MPEGNQPSEPQLNFARKIAEAMGTALPDDVAADRRKLSAWIDANAQNAPQKDRDDTATPAQINAAERIAQAKGIDVPPEAMKSKALLSKWIDANGSKSGKASGGKGRKTTRKKG